MKVDTQRRLMLTAGIAARLCASPGTKLLVTCDPNSGRVMLVNLGTLADAIDTLLTDRGDVGDDVTQAVEDRRVGGGW